MPAREFDTRHAGRPGLALLVASMAMFLNTVDISILNVAMPAIQKELGIRTTALQWLQGAYGLPYAGFLLLSGRIADVLGRRRTFFAGVAMFGLASLAGTFSPSFAWLLVARAVQGLGAALMVPAAIAIITNSFPEGAARNRALGVFAAVAASGFSSGLAAGALITEFLSWRWVFFVNVPFAALILSLVSSAVPADTQRQRRSIGLLQSAAVTAGLISIIYAVTTLAEPAGSGRNALIAAAAGALLLAAFAIAQRLSRNPLMPVALFGQRNLVAASLASMGQLGSAFGFFFLCSIFLQTAVGLSPLQAGFALLPMSIVSALVSHFAAPLVANRWTPRFAFITGLCFQGAGVLAFAMADAQNGLLVAVVASVLLGGFGMGLSYPSVSLVALQGVPADLQASASGVQNTALQTGGALGTALVATVIGTFGSNFATLAPAVQLTARNGCVAALAGLVATSIAAMALFGKPGESAFRREPSEFAGPL